MSLSKEFVSAFRAVGRSDYMHFLHIAVAKISFAEIDVSQHIDSKSLLCSDCPGQLLLPLAARPEMAAAHSSPLRAAATLSGHFPCGLEARQPPLPGFLFVAPAFEPEG
jgi:hypothetical protein